MLIKIDKHADLVSDISEVVTKYIIEGDGSFTISNDNILQFQNEIDDTVKNYSITQKDFLNGVSTLNEEYRKFFDMYHNEYSEFREYKLLAQKRITKLNEERQFFIDLLIEKCKELDELKMRTIES